MTIKPKIKMADVLSMNCNAFVLLATFKKRAKMAGWKIADIEEVIKEATSGDYGYLLQVISLHTK